MLDRNSYWKVTKAGELPIKTGIAATNRWYGASQIYENTTEALRVVRGDEVHALHGGTFLVRAGKTLGEVYFADPFGSRFYDRDAQLGRWLGEHAAQITNPTKPASYR